MSKTYNYTVFFTRFENEDFQPVHETYFVLEKDVEKFKLWCSEHHVTITNVEYGITSNHILHSTIKISN